MDINAKFEVSIWGVISVAATSAAVVVAATWGVAKMTESNELQAYKASKEWKAAEAIASLQDLSKSVKLEVDEQKELQSLRRRMPELEREHAETVSQFAQVKSDAASLRETLASLVKDIDEIEIPVNESRFVIPKTVLVGVHTIYSTANRCGVRIGNRSEYLEVGQPLGVPFAGKDYVLTLSKVAEKSCTFAFAERPKS